MILHCTRLLGTNYIISDFSQTMSDKQQLLLLCNKY